MRTNIENISEIDNYADSFSASLLDNEALKSSVNKYFDSKKKLEQSMQKIMKQIAELEGSEQDDEITDTSTTDK